jgi:hypothetical protein
MFYYCLLNSHIMKVVFSIFLALSVGVVCAQPSQVATDDQSLELEERYSSMKAGSQTFKDYKVIKEVVLDKVWKITLDSIKKKEQQLAEAEQQIASLSDELTASHNSMEAQQASMKDVIYDSTHIHVLGVPFTKSLFLIVIATVVGGLVFLLTVSFARVKIANSLVKEKELIADSVSHEFEEYKKKSMEKQTKLSRELQNERNKWQEYRKA